MTLSDSEKEAMDRIWERYHGSEAIKQAEGAMMQAIFDIGFLISVIARLTEGTVSRDD